jgi:hypothetical protein
VLPDHGGVRARLHRPGPLVDHGGLGVRLRGADAGVWLCKQTNKQTNKDQ